MLVKKIQCVVLETTLDNVESYEESWCTKLVTNLSQLYLDCTIKEYLSVHRGAKTWHNNTQAAACLTTNAECEPPPEPPRSTASPVQVECLVPPSPDDISPKKLGETRHGAIEAKYGNQQTESAATLELQANMILLTASLLHSKINSLRTSLFYRDM